MKEKIRASDQEKLITPLLSSLGKKKGIPRGLEGLPEDQQIAVFLDEGLQRGHGADELCGC